MALSGNQQTRNAVGGVGKPYTGFVAKVTSFSHTFLKSLTLDLGGGIGTTLGLKGNTLPVTVVTTVPSAEPAGGQGIVFYISGGALTVYAWDPDTTAWVT